MGFTKEEAKQRLSEVISRFKRWQKEGRLNNEDDIKDLTQELFEKVLGWDKDDIYRERHPGPTSKRVDLQFRINGAVKLLLETKAIDVPWDKTVLRQAIGYGWGSNEEYVILTNFQKIILFNAKWKDEDKKIFGIDNIEECLTSEQKLEFLLLLGKESFGTGKIDEFSESIGKKLKKLPIATIEEQLLNDLRKWREMLTSNIKTLNKLSEEEVDDTVQKIINRLIFIRVCEDRGLEPDFPELRSHLRIWSEKKNKTLIEALVTIFHHFDDVYDGTIFQKNDLCERVNIHNSVLERIIEELYVAKDMNTEYNFSSINADVLGSVYEQYLGYLLRGKKVSESHAHKKESGIYYTPTYIVDYIVRNTLGEVLKQKKDIDKIKVLDPACGSGSFLIKVFDIFSDFWKAHVGEDKFDRQIKNNILTHNIYGVDLDPKAVEISQLNLFLKIGEKGELPKLRENIKCGNSLIDEDKIVGDKAFAWNSKFTDIMNSGGFDVIIGNPPYINNRNLPKEEKEFFETRYSTAYQQYDIYVLFYELALKLLKPGGYLGFITPNKFAITNYGTPLRKLLLNYKIVKIVDVSQLGVFSEASTYPYIVILQKTSARDNKFNFYTPDSQNLINMSYTQINQTEIKNEEPFLFGHNAVEISIMNKISGGKLLDVYRAKPTTKNIGKSGDALVVTNRDIERYRLNDNPNNIQKKKEWVVDVPAILMKKICFVPEATILKSNDKIPVNTVYVLKSKVDNVSLEYILAVLNSKLIGYYARKRYSATAMRGGFVELRAFEVEDIPIKFSSNKNQSIENLVEIMLSLKTSLQKSKFKSSSEVDKLKEEINNTDEEIDKIVYEIYGITSEEQNVIENYLRSQVGKHG